MKMVKEIMLDVPPAKIIWELTGFRKSWWFWELKFHCGKNGPIAPNDHSSTSFPINMPSTREGHISRSTGTSPWWPSSEFPQGRVPIILEREDVHINGVQPYQLCGSSALRDRRHKGTSLRILQCHWEAEVYSPRRPYLQEFWFWSEEHLDWGGEPSRWQGGQYHQIHLGQISQPVKNPRKWNEIRHGQ